MSHFKNHSKHHRWIIAAAAVGIHLSIGSVYAYSVWKIPLTTLTGWSEAQVALGFSLAILFLGITAAFSGRFIDRRHPRANCLLAAALFGIGLVLSGVSAHVGFLPGYYLGYGLIGGMGLGLGYVAPVSTLLRWFPDRRGLAAGLATMGFGFGAMLAGPLISRQTQILGVPETFYLLGGIYFTVMALSSLWMKNPPADWAERFSVEAKIPPLPSPPALDALPGQILRSPAYLLLWFMFFLNILCGIALISIASPMAMEITGMSPKSAATMVGIMGLFNGLGRIGWSAASDRIGRKQTWVCFFLVQIVAFGLLPGLTNPLAFQLAVFVILTCYGGGFATAPAFLGDLFGARHLSTLYGVLLTAWAAAGLLGPLFIAWLRDWSGSYQMLPPLFAGFLFMGILGLWGLSHTRKGSFENL
ncbi:MAG: OFA family MFS transporter [Verrucomicrobia bacterium]|nr:OFA family MFS transporter [Verrucomicrobiota bacterium]MCH8511435.1 OFA family MFS transporter [Kiritimatiellia bacterium]